MKYICSAVLTRVAVVYLSFWTSQELFSLPLFEAVCLVDRNLRDREFTKNSETETRDLKLETETRDFKICGFCRNFSKNVSSSLLSQISFEFLPSFQPVSLVSYLQTQHTKNIWITEVLLSISLRYSKSQDNRLVTETCSLRDLSWYKAVVLNISSPGNPILKDIGLGTLVCRYVVSQCGGRLWTWGFKEKVYHSLWGPPQFSLGNPACIEWHEETCFANLC